MKRPLAGFPLKLPLLAVVATAASQVLVALPWASMPAAQRWIHLAILLLWVYAGLRVAAWLSLELPGQLGLWKGPSKILRDLGLLLLAATVTVILVERQGHISLVGLITTSAVLTAVIGLAAQETLKDLFAGITLQLDPPFREGDWIDLGEARGHVSQLTLMNTHLLAVDGAQVVLSNSSVAQSNLRRFRPSFPVGNRFSISLDCSFPPSQAIALIGRVVGQHPQVLQTPSASVWVNAYADSAITYEVLAFQRNTGDRANLQLRSDLLEQLWYALEREGQSLPYPVREIRRHRPSTQGADPSPNIGRLLADNPLLTSLRLDQLQLLAENTSLHRFGSGEVVVREGDPGDALYQVIQGSVSVTKARDDGDIHVATLHVGDVFGEMTLCVDEPRNATIRTLEESVLLCLERRDLLPLVTSDPSTLDGIAQLVAQRKAMLEQHSNVASRSSDTILQRMRELFQSMR